MKKGEIGGNTPDIRDYFLNGMISVGSLLILFYRLAGRSIRAFYHKFLFRHTVRLRQFWLTVRRRLSGSYQTLLKKWYGTRKFWHSVRMVVQRGYGAHPDKAKVLRWCDAVTACFLAAGRHTYVFRRLLNYLVPLTAAAAFIFLVNYAFSLNYAVSVECNGKQIGYVENEAVFHESENKIQARMLYQEDDEIFQYSTRFTVTVVSEDELQNSAQLTNTLISNSDADIVEATGLIIDGTFLGASKDIVPVKEHLDELLAQYKENDTDRVEFTKSVELEEGLYLQSNIVEAQSLIDKIESKAQVERYYTTVAGDTPISIAQKNGITLDTLVSLNPDILTNCPIGKHVLITKPERFLSVKRIVNTTYTVEMDYGTTYVDTSSLYKGQTQERSAGVKGEKTITADISYVDGVEVGREILSTQITKQPVDRVVLRGTAEMPSVSGGGGNASSYGLVWPTSGANRYISSGWGAGRNHRGIDICYYGGAYGKTIVASHAGTVTYSGWKSSYGWVVMIDSGNGITTTYAHCSKLAVSTGQTVARGQYIANIGSSGNSSGPHLHFELNINGRRVNPLLYLP